MSREGRLLVMGANQQPVVFDAADIKLVNPSPGASVTATSGTARPTRRCCPSEVIPTPISWMDFESIWRSVEDRYTVRAAWEVDATDGVENKNTARQRTSTTGSGWMTRQLLRRPTVVRAR